ncbi:substrate-binding periplasmic protein [Bdellovibrio svalbardensis]|uniref:Transporter substrate-binding domain-containing protein n=1 Tax=Bdellovibrio svalbardensis TaxID=2972972 RepID=A0ABT6DKT4_9BACT|nr:transporter substrate-binding domain-containing protein [Bdellovibrio svalbardensis]MDG0817480.1 transporter substrate-binding domain-containing protein [Bdellovibrio svalbardensis]
MKRAELIGFIVLFVSLAQAKRQTASAPTVIRINYSAAQNAPELTYEEELITLLLDKTKSKYGAYRLQRTFVGASQNRAILELDKNTLDVFSTMTSHEREELAHPIRYCMYKGLLGVRAALIKNDSNKELEKIASLQNLRRYKIGQAFDWPDHFIQESSGLNVMSFPNLDKGIRQLRESRIDLLPLGIVEIYPVAAKNHLKVINSWVLAYLAPYYYFVSKSNSTLIRRLEEGFELTIKDGSFDALFNKKIGPLLKEAHLDQRKVIYLRNPMLPDDLPLQNKERWHPFVRQQLIPREQRSRN